MFFKNIIPAIIITCLFYLSGCSSSGGHYHLNNSSRQVKTGLEVFIKKYSRRYINKKIILVTNHSGVDFFLRQNIELLRSGGLTVILAMAPEHGLFGFQEEFDGSLYTEQKNHNLLVYNLHNLNDHSLKFILKSGDLVFFDIQDMGMRCYTYISNLKHIMDALNGSGTELIVLDRPNPISFLGVDGAYLDKNFTTRFVSAFPTPFIYDMTIGESATYYRNEYTKNVRLRVIKMENYQRNMLYSQTGLPWIPPSPNLPTYESSIIYTAVVLLEGINISLGRGTAKPFEYIGAPWIEPYSFTKKVRKLRFKNFRFRPVYFKPAYGHHQGKRCGGVQIFYTGGKFSPTEFSFRIIKLLMKEYNSVVWLKHKQIFRVDHLAGTDLFRKLIDRGLPFRSFSDKIKKDVDVYKSKRAKYLLY